MTISCDRLKQVDFSSVYFEADTRVLVLKNSAAKRLGSLGGQKVCATAGSDSATIISGYPVTPRLVLVTVPQWTDCLVLLQQGKVAAISTDDAILAGLHAQDPFTTVVGPPLAPQPYGLAISKQHPDFVRFVNAVLAQDEADGDWAASYGDWVGNPYRPRRPRTTPTDPADDRAAGFTVDIDHNPGAWKGSPQTPRGLHRPRRSSRSTRRRPRVAASATGPRSTCLPLAATGAAGVREGRTGRDRPRGPTDGSSTVASS